MSPHGLSMLWETWVKPDTALRERFGFDGIEGAGSWIATVLAERWGIVSVGCSRLVISDRNAIAWTDTDRGALVVKWSRGRERFDALQASTRLLRTLGEQGVPVAVPISTRDGLDRVTVEAPADALSVTVLPELTGQWLDIEDDRAVRSAGAGLALVHRALSRQKFDEPTHAGQGLDERVGQWSKKHDQGWAPTASARLNGILSGLPEIDQDIQLVHNDFRSANVLTRDSRVVGILDFDEILPDYPVVDLAKASVYLGTRFTDWGPTPRAAQQTFRAGYETVSPLSSSAAQWLDVLVLWHGIMAVTSGNDAAAWVAAL